MMRRICVAAALAATFCIPASAMGQDKAAAEEAFRNGRRLLADGKQAEACEAFALSQKLDPAVGTLLNLANCHEAIGRTASAWAEFTEAAERAARAGQAARAGEARNRASALEPRLNRLLVRYGGERPAGLEVLRDDVDMTLLLGTATPVDPGEHKLEARSRGFESWTDAVEVKGEGETVEVEIPPLERAPEAAPAGAGQPAPGTAGDQPAADLLGEAPGADGSRQRTRRYIAIGVGGVGLASIVTSLVFGAQAQSKWNEAHDDGHCDDDNRCDPVGMDLVDDAKSAATMSTIFVAAGTAAAVGGVVLWLTAPSPKRADKRQTVRLMPGPGNAGVAIRVSF